MGTAIDISNYSGRLNGTQCEWLRDRYDLVIVRLSTEDNRGQRAIAAQQVLALAEAGIPWQGYLWMYWDVYPEVLWERATAQLPADWPYYSGTGIWLDLEDQPDDTRLAATCLQAYCDILETDDFQPGVYSGPWWVEQNPWITEGRIAKKMSQLPVWWANYNVQASCNLGMPYPFVDLAMHQHTSYNALGPMMACDISEVCRVV